MTERAPFRDALRILFLLVSGGKEESNLPQGARGIFRGETRLHAFDFWMRYPDYIANELLDRYERMGDPRLLSEVEEIFASDEPSIRKYPMIRFRYGAYERLDDTLAILASRDMIHVTGRKAGEQVLETDFLLMPKAYAALDHIVDDYPDIVWYRDRSRLIAALAGDRGGSELKDRQYEVIDYAKTKMGGTIPSLSDQVWARLTSMLAVRKGAA